MMKLICILAVMLAWTTLVMAETYYWIDEQGTYNFTEEYSRVPVKYRNRVDRRGDTGNSAASKVAVPSPVSPDTQSPDTAKNTSTGTSQSPMGSFGGKSYEQWRQEFSQREAAMEGLKLRIDEIDLLLKKSASDNEQSQVLITERNRATVQFLEQRKQYDQLADQARKAGIQVNISQ